MHSKRLSIICLGLLIHAAALAQLPSTETTTIRAYFKREIPPDKLLEFIQHSTARPTNIVALADSLQLSGSPSALTHLRAQLEEHFGKDAILSWGTSSTIRSEDAAAHIGQSVVIQAWLLRAKVNGHGDLIYEFGGRNRDVVHFRVVRVATRPGTLKEAADPGQGQYLVNGTLTLQE